LTDASAIVVPELLLLFPLNCDNEGDARGGGRLISDSFVE